jgi:branched-chain amino acid transport system permease protein
VATFAQLALSGLAIGSIYALIGLGLVLIHKATDVVNFAQGEMAMFMTFVAYFLLTAQKMPLWSVFLVAPILGALLSGIVAHVVMRPLANAPPANALITTIGLWIVFNSAAGWIWGYDPYRFPSLFPTDLIPLFGVALSPNAIGIIVVAASVMVALYLFFEFTREGIAMRAASMNQRAAQLMGIRPTQVSFVAWAVAGALGTLCGMLVAPALFLDFEMMTQVLLKAFAGVILGGFNSAPGAVVGCVLLGVMESFFGGYVSTAFKNSFSFVIIVAVLMVRPTGLFASPGVKKV